MTLMPYPCSHFYFNIKFDDRLYTKEKRPDSPLLFWIWSVAKFDIKVKVTYMGRVLAWKLCNHEKSSKEWDMAPHSSSTPSSSRRIEKQLEDSLGWILLTPIVQFPPVTRLLPFCHIGLLVFSKHKSRFIFWETEKRYEETFHSNMTSNASHIVLGL